MPEKVKPLLLLYTTNYKGDFYLYKSGSPQSISCSIPYIGESNFIIANYFGEILYKGKGGWKNKHSLKDINKENCYPIKPTIEKQNG